ncbi:hypothetical protein FEK35_01860 [Nocardia cyriacigeorgica]|uniref:Type II toxin-antitoxin system RelE/ParE family toxin n=1 Tax=Nocardia cyriacigeorgica TaxID=135487 RepID=A0A5R8PLH3_9NOCA|nr:hypothetical protein FEK35_01860 [Nocardia cyriacigeorgica]
MYRIVPDAATIDQVAALPIEALLPYSEILTVLELDPWAGEPQHRGNPDGAVRRWIFGPEGAGQLVYLVVEDRREVHLLRVLWLG